MMMQEKANPGQESPQQAILRMTRGFEIAQCLFAVAQLGIADLLKENPKSCDELAQATHTDREALSRLLRALVSMGMLADTPAGLFQLTPLSACLLTDAPGSLRNFILVRAEVDYACWGQLLYSVRTGKSAFDHVFGMNRYEYHQHHPDTGQLFDRAMADLAIMHHAAILDAYDFAPFGTLVDVGGGQGNLIAAILQRYPNLKGILFDQAATIAQARGVLANDGVLDRCDLVAGDFFAAAPAGADVYVLKQVLHNWDDDHARIILHNCRQAMAANGKLLVIERVITPDGSLHSHLVDLRMMIVTDSGRTRTETEFRKLFETAGFTLRRIVPTTSGISIIEGAKQ
jgi:SAM-dependent methyltransferase